MATYKNEKMRLRTNSGLQFDQETLPISEVLYFSTLVVSHSSILMASIAFTVWSRSPSCRHIRIINPCFSSVVSPASSPSSGEADLPRSFLLAHELLCPVPRAKAYRHAIAYAWSPEMSLVLLACLGSCISIPARQLVHGLGSAKFHIPRGIKAVYLVIHTSLSLYSLLFQKRTRLTFLS